MLNFLLPVLGSVLAAKVSSNSQAKLQQQQQQYAEDALQEQRLYDRGTLQRIRDDALESGLNPLTVLRNGGASIGANTYLQPPSLSSNDFIGQALMEGINTGFNAPQRELDEETQRLQNDLYRAQIGELQANTAHLQRDYGFGIPAVETLGVSQTSMSEPPLARPTMETLERIPVFLPNGKQVEVPKSWADRMGVGQFGYVAMGDYTELVGEIRGEGEGTLLMPEIGNAAGVPLFGQSPPLSSDANPLNSGPNWSNYWK